MNVCILTPSDGDNADATIHTTHAEAQAALHQWCRECWVAEAKDHGAQWPHGEPPVDDAEMYEAFRDWAGDTDFQWHLYTDVPLPELP